MSQSDSGTEEGRGPSVPEDLGRFDRSFLVHMISSFLVFLVAVAALELSLRFAFAYHDFRTEGPETVKVAADQLASDVRDIMVNRGGPVASRTVYPILDRTFRRAGLEVAIQPSEATVESIREGFGFSPRGLPPDFTDGTFHEAKVDLRADDLCLQCHTSAAVGDVLGTVTVREYRDTRFEGWWQEARLTGTVNVLKILVHTVILFFLLRVLMEPLLSLRSAVGRLARGEGGLDVRARVQSSDEFGELAADLNAFLDRLSRIVEDLGRTLSRTVATSTRLAGVTGRVEEQLEAVESALKEAVRVSHEGGEPDRTLERLPRLIHEVHDLKHLLREIGFLEDQLLDVADDGKNLLDRLADSGARER